jgi:hypothetical protein
MRYQGPEQRHGTCRCRRRQNPAGHGTARVKVNTTPDDGADSGRRSGEGAHPPPGQVLADGTAQTGPSRRTASALDHVHRLDFDHVDPGAVAAAGHDLAALPAPEGQDNRTGVDPVPRSLLEPHAPTLLTARRSPSRSRSGMVVTSAGSRRRWRLAGQHAMGAVCHRPPGPTWRHLLMRRVAACGRISPHLRSHHLPQERRRTSPDLCKRAEPNRRALPFVASDQ